MFILLTIFLISTSAFEHLTDDWGYETMPAKGECPEGKIPNQRDCDYSDIGTCEDESCWGGELDVTTLGCGCILLDDGKRYYNEPSGKTCNAGKEAAMICKQKMDVDTCQNVDGWTVTCDSDCEEFGSKYDQDSLYWFRETHGHMDTSYFTMEECAALCIGECVGFEMHLDGCGYFYTGTIFSDPNSLGDGRSCVQRTPPLDEDCADYDAGEGWVVDCGHDCHRESNKFGIAEWDIPWTTGASIAECAKLCEAGDCDHFNFNPQNGGSCQFFNETIISPGSLRIVTDGACVHRGIPGQNPEPDEADLPDCPKSEIWQLFWSCHGESKPDEFEDSCEEVDWMFSKDGCCKDCSQCAREYIEAKAGIDCESEGGFFSKIMDGNFSALTTLELVGVAAVALVLVLLICVICCCCCKCSERNKQVILR